MLCVAPGAVRRLADGHPDESAAHAEHGGDPALHVLLLGLGRLVRPAGRGPQERGPAARGRWLAVQHRDLRQLAGAARRMQGRQSVNQIIAVVDFLNIIPWERRRPSTAHRCCTTDAG